MAKTQINMWMDDETVETARRAAETRRIPGIDDYACRSPLSSVTVAVAHACLIAAGVPAKPARKRVSALVAELKEESCTAGSVAVVLKSWAV